MRSLFSVYAILILLTLSELNVYINTAIVFEQNLNLRTGSLLR
jgi:hypothetical protein